MSIKRTIRNKNYCYTEYNNGYCVEYKYNNDGHVIYHRDSNSNKEYTYEYNDDGNLICKYCDGELYDFYEYDEDNNKIYEWFNTDHDCFEGWYEYDERGNCIHEYNTNGYEAFYEYNENNEEISCYDTNIDTSIIQ